MRQVRYTDSTDRIWITSIPDDAPNGHASMGLIVGPPDLSALELPEPLAIRLHNALVERDILTWHDFRRNRAAVLGALKWALKADIQALEILYRAELD
ncbi:MAG: hypothetical protein V3R71_01605 [Gemmatimonadales bacterium]